MVKRYEGDIKGTSTTKWLMAYAPDKRRSIVGIEHITGTVGGKEGGLVLMHDGQFRDGVASARCAFVRHGRAGRRGRRAGSSAPTPPAR